MRATFTFLALMCSLLSSAQLTVNTFDEVLHEGANTVQQTFDFPDDISGYDQILMHFHLSCPPGGCDPWDRYANIKVVDNGTSYEIGRYTTPYLNSWCDWTLDVSDYRNFLSGEVTLESFIDTWSNGWEITVDFEFIEGTPDYAYTEVVNLWVDYFVIYGDTLFYTINLEELDVLIPDNAEMSVLRIMNTGHGQGNTDNAAEFSFKTHEIHVNGNLEFTQELWKDDCDANPCSPQSGTWEYSRAGWCPGQEVTPWDYDVTSIVTPGTTASFDYVLEPFYNYCSPWNPDCDNSTCTDCTYNGGTHTQPHYKLASQLIFYSSSPLHVEETPSENNATALNLYPNPVQDLLRVNLMSLEIGDWNIQVFNALGVLVSEQHAGTGLGFNQLVNTHLLQAGQYSVVVSDGVSTYRQTFIKH